MPAMRSSPAVWSALSERGFEVATPHAHLTAGARMRKWASASLSPQKPAISATGALTLQLFSAWRTARAPSGLCAPSTITFGSAAAN
ncbi:MAG: hypothetical protein BWX70_03199 [Verrucomicrobia bacterium ADurb.Bin070]|nr:MAG: hypothetical protein BWX70_03199 [Verrucomicrobia bacterium ADurb.Bin070]